MSVCFWWNIGKRKKKNEKQDGLDSSPEPVRSSPKKSSTPEPIEIDSVPELPTQNLTHITKNRAKRTKNVRPTTRQSTNPATKVAIDTGEVDENVEEFFSKPSVQVSVNVTEKKDETPTKTSSTKSTPESKKKLGGLFNFGHKDKDKESKTKDAKKSGGLFSKLSPKPASSPKKGARISDVVEEADDTSSLNSSLTRSVTENSSLRGSFDRQSTKSSDSSSPKVTRSASTLSEKKDKTSEKSDSLERKANDTVEKSDAKSTKIEDVKPQKEEKTDKSDTQEGEKAKVVKEEKTESQNEEKPEENVDDNKEEKSTAEDVAEDKPEKAVVEKAVKDEEKKPIKPPMTKRSFNKADINKDETVDQVKDATDVKVTENEKKEENDDKNDTKAKADEVTEGDGEKGETGKKPFKPPAGVAVGFGANLNLLAEMKSKQEKRKSLLPTKPPPAAATDKPSAESEEKKFPFGTRNLKPFNKPVPSKETETDTNNSGVPVKPADNKTSGPVKLTGSQSDSKSTESVDKKSELVEKKTDKVVVEDKKDNGSVKGESTPLGLQKTNSQKSDTSEKPAVVPRPSGFSRPQPPAKPRPPPPGSKPLPAPRKSTSGDGDNALESNKTPDKTVESGIVYDSATLKMSVKDKISKFGKPGAQNEAGQRKSLQNEAGQGKSLSQHATKKEPVEKSEVADKEKSTSLPQDVTLSEADKTTKDNTSEKNGENSKAAGSILENRSSNESIDMTDSGIVYDDDSLKSDNNKSASLPRNTSLNDSKDDSPVAPKRPKSMLAVLESRPDLKKHSKDVSDIPEEDSVPKTDKNGTKDGDKSPTEEIILV